GACLADDMGLGKTIQVITLLLIKKQQAKKNKRPSLLILPASLLSNWKAELQAFAPSLKAVYVHASEMSSKRLDEMAAQPERQLQGVDLVFTTYSTLLRQPWLQEQLWELVVLDEAQAIKNPTARQSKAVKTLKGRARIALTGTPVENRLGDLWSLFDFLCPGLLGSAARFKQFIKALEQQEPQSFAPLRQLVQPYILRRLKTDPRVISDLPDKTEVIAWCTLSTTQVKYYRQVVESLSKSLQEIDGIKRRGAVLSSLMRLKQICNHPSQLLDDDTFTPSHSGKFLRLREICEEIASRQEKVLIFTQFREITAPLAQFLAEVFGQPGLVLHGGTPVKQRKKLVDCFQNECGFPFFVLSLKAAGVGLNLTAASHVVHFDRWWNPAVENQATDRAFRIGQKRNVLVHKFVCRGSVEEKIDNLINEKRQLAEDVLTHSGEATLTELDDKRLIELVSLDIEQTQF
ncbi:MAG: DEAD/DEAH box helicase, partial [Gammaproteobacteria bacterium]